MDSDFNDLVKHYIDKTKPYSDLNDKFKSQLIDKVTINASSINYKQKTKKLLLLLVYKYFRKEVATQLRILEPDISKKKLIKAQDLAFRKAVGDKHKADIIFCNSSKWCLHRNMTKKFKRYLLGLAKSTAPDKIIKSQAQVALYQMKNHSKTLRAIEYVTIPAIMFALPEVFSAFLITITGGFFSAVGAGLVLYASHFATINMVPRLVLSIVGDGIAYWINKKRDERA